MFRVAIRLAVIALYYFPLRVGFFNSHTCIIKSGDILDFIFFGSPWSPCQLLFLLPLFSCLEVVHFRFGFPLVHWQNHCFLPLLLLRKQNFHNFALSHMLFDIFLTFTLLSSLPSSSLSIFGFWLFSSRAAVSLLYNNQAFTTQISRRYQRWDRNGEWSRAVSMLLKSTSPLCVLYSEIICGQSTATRARSAFDHLSIDPTRLTQT